MRRAIDQAFERRLGALVNAREPGVLQGGLKGVERESLRVLPDGHIAHTPHPAPLGSALSNEHITTDFSEALIELVTPPFASSWELLQYLCDLHQFVYRHLGEELLWATSMPCPLRSDEDVPTAWYGNSHVGQMKRIYREGLRHRYGALMQAISGVHYNYSFPSLFWEVYASAREQSGGTQDFRSASYFDLLRNYRRMSWIVLYLFGTSPAVGRDFLGDDMAGLVPLDDLTAYGPHATSLRMSDLGYRNRDQAGVSVSANSLTEYVRDLRRAIGTPHPAYQQLGLKRDGKWLQLNCNVLQIENEFYSAIRPKRVARSGESPSSALLRGGVEYVEMRALDVSAFDPVGVNQTREGRQLPLAIWAAEILDSMTGICELLDHGDSAKPYTAALRAQQEKLLDVARTPSARLLHELHSSGESFFAMALRMSRLHRDYFGSLADPPAGRMAAFEGEARESIAAQAAIESADSGSFEQYLERYFAAATR